jgi:hypothetical protein
VADEGIAALDKLLAGAVASAAARLSEQAIDLAGDVQEAKMAPYSTKPH